MWRTSKGLEAKVEAQSKPTSSLFRGSGPVCTKTEAQDAYGLGFGRSTYARKDKKKTFPMPPVSYQNSSGVIGNRQNKRESRICFGAASPVFGLWALYLVEPN